LKVAAPCGSKALSHTLHLAGFCRTCIPYRVPNPKAQVHACGAGDLIKSLRTEKMAQAKAASTASIALANSFGVFAASVPWLLSGVGVLHGVVGATPLQATSSFLNKVTGHLMPVWNPYMPLGAARLKSPPTPAPVPAAEAARGLPRRVVYLPSCVTRMMGPAKGDPEKASVHEKMMSIMAKAGYEVIVPKGVESSCCGMLFNTRGFAPAAASKMSSLEALLLKASDGGKVPIVVDTSPCLMQIKTSLSTPALRFALYEPIEFINHFLVDKLEWRKVCYRQAVCYSDASVWLHAMGMNEHESYDSKPWYHKMR
jgi:D-lactate dehydrogenase